MEDLTLSEREEKLLAELTKVNEELVTLQRRLVRALVDLDSNRKWLDVTLSSIADGVIATGREGSITFVNSEAVILTGITVEKAMGRNAADILFIHDGNSGERLSGLVNKAMTERQSLRSDGDLYMRNADGSNIPIDISIAPMLTFEGGADGVVMILRNVSKQKELEKTIREMAIRDPLTKLYNHAEFYRIMGVEMARTKRYSRPLSVMMLDIDHFKKINDTHGHLCGDEVLVKFASIVRGGLRTMDYVARVGGEEFTVIMPESDLKAALLVAERLRKKIEETPVEYEGKSIHITASIGVADKWGGAENVIELVKAADRALYFSKESGRNRVSGDPHCH